jgi:two-component system chemotaxis response regulator CheB
MPRSFTGPFARRLDSIAPMRVMELVSQTLLEPGSAYIAKGEADVIFSNVALGLAALPAPANRKYLWHPSVTCMVESAMTVLPPERVIGVQLTGMGDDGASAFAELHRRGGRTIAQDEDSCVVFGMPAELIRQGGADAILPAHRIAGQLVSWLSPPKSKTSPREARHGTR